MEVDIIEKLPSKDKSLTTTQKAFLYSELIVGRISMIFFASGILNEFLSGKSLFQQIGLNSPTEQAALFALAITSAFSFAGVLGLYCIRENDRKAHAQLSRLGRVYRDNEWPRWP